MYFLNTDTGVYSIFIIYGTFAGLVVSSWSNPSNAPPQKSTGRKVNLGIFKNKGRNNVPEQFAGAPPNKRIKSG
jgi:hypothetical protein